ncbi:uncharacterized protein LACBIDRAFT_327254 [Laccaria bicolor S238N-H82]|uniref:Predicted protein n=1 Tax=Laccaria bicolor (strain S238N-H82 / ATCC MYA-4686) TaxID=486041 RepID=B0DBN1_LACBS|nr:uncharacterized protein LACBIDRAFT_327254 [Laccaria bicolor S238N-H82]EDR08028.1 predicted protein [Laccaria bicolor S238N-H82]|eukprot:XP_001881098.1 predicted protein [Laccaria bicolor S238N-H82]
MSTDEVNPYELLSVKVESTEQEIRTAYRQRSLKVHPDRNPNNPDAARKFHELNQAYELLLDPLRRLALDAKLRVKQAKAERFKNYDNKRKNLVEELEAKEREYKKARVDKQKEEVDKWHQTEKIKEEGRKLREERELLMRARQQQEPRADQEEDVPPALVRLKYKLKTHQELTTPESIAALLSPFGSVDAESIVISLKNKSSSGKPPKYVTALVPFRQIGSAFAAVCASNQGVLDGVEAGWVGGQEPEILVWLKKMGKLGAQPQPPVRPSSSLGLEGDLPQTETDPPSSFPSFPTSPLRHPIPTSAPPDLTAAGIDYESLTLMRLRQTERERLEREIREQEDLEQ